MIAFGLIAGFLLLIAGADGLVRGGAALALRLGMSPLVVGLTVVSFGTSMPELMVSLQAAFAGTSDMAVGNVVGSNIANLALILGIAAIMRPLSVEPQLLRLDLPVALVASLSLWLMLVDGEIGRTDGIMLLGSLVIYTTYLIVSSRRDRSPPTDDVIDLPVAPVPVLRSVAYVALGMVGLVIGASLFVTAATALARTIGVTEAVIGLTVVAVGTSLPELATSVVAALKKEGDISVGNCIGSNIFNILGIVGASALAFPLSLGNVRPLDLGAMVAVAFLIVPLLRTGYRLTRLEGGLLLICYVVYIWTLIPS